MGQSTADTVGAVLNAAHWWDLTLAEAVEVLASDPTYLAWCEDADDRYHADVEDDLADRLDGAA